MGKCFGSSVRSRHFAGLFLNYFKFETFVFFCYKLKTEMPIQFYAIIPFSSLPFIEQKEHKFAFNHFANHRADRRHLLFINEGDIGSFLLDIAGKPELDGTTTDISLPIDFLTHWEQVLQPGTDLSEIESNFADSTDDFVAP